MSLKIVTVENEEVPKVTANAILDGIRRAIAARGRAVVALSGGSSAGKIFRLFVPVQDIDWTKVYLFLVDERFIDREVVQYNNYQSLYSVFLEKVSPPPNHFPLNYKAATPEICAREYAETIRTFFTLKEGEWPVFDVIHLGMGPDGHTASLFPNSTATHVDDRLAVANHAGLNPWIDRITLTFPVINHAREIVFSVPGAAKAQKVREMMELPTDKVARPASGINPVDGNVLWILDYEAASLL